MSAENSPPIAEPGTIPPTMPWLVIRIEDGESVSEHRSEAAAVRAARKLGDGYTVRQSGAGRTRKELERRTSTYLIRMTPSRRARYDAAAEEAGIPLSDWITEACDAYLGDEE